MDALRQGAKVKVKFGNVLVDGVLVEIGPINALVKIEKPNAIVKIAVSRIIADVRGQRLPEQDQHILNPFDGEIGILVKKHKSLESLRFGLVPQYALEDLTIGYDNIREWILSRLPGNNSKLSMISEVYGSYGTGKSHMMALIRYLAKLNGYVTAHVEINGKDVSLEDPESLSSHLWKTVEAKNIESDTPLLDIYVQAIDKTERCPTISPRVIDRTRDNFNTIKLIKRKGLLDNYSHDYNALLSCSSEITATELYLKICREPNISPIIDQPRVRKLIGRAVVERGQDFVESLIGNAVICQLAGFKGLVITIDEFEIQRLSSKLDRVAAVLTCLLDYLKGKTGHKAAPLSIFIASVGHEEHLGDKIIDAMIKQCEGEFYSLKVLDENDCVELGRRIFNLYKGVYNLQFLYDDKEAKDIYQRIKIEEGHVRKFIKYYIGYLDMEYGPPGKNAS